jgi:hypothetical protein
MPLGWRDALAPADALALLTLTRGVARQGSPQLLQITLTLALVALVALVAPLGPWLYDLCFKPIAAVHRLVPPIVSIALPMVLVDLARLMFDAEGAHTRLFAGDVLSLGTLRLTAPAVWVVAGNAGLDRCALGGADGAHHPDAPRLWLSDQPEGLRRRGRRWAGALSGRGAGCTGRGSGRGLFHLLRPCRRSRTGLHTGHALSAVAFAHRWP